MATTPLGARLTRTYRRESAALKAAVLRDILDVWPVLDLADVSRTWPALLAALKLILGVRRTQSVAAAETYLRRFRAAEGITTGFRTVRAPAMVADAVDVSLGATGPATIIRSLNKGHSVGDASKLALTTVGGAATRIALDGGRQTVVLTVDDDRQALGWMRVTRPGACAFCAMLASRGPVYKTSRSAGDDTNRFHDHCLCDIEPVYSRATTWPESSRNAHDLWASSTASLSGRDAMKAFRVAYEATL